jgi:predicted cupin superfamily sugar epimerase
MDAKTIIDLLKLEPLPHEGGFFRQTYKSKRALSSGHPLSTAIYYLVTEQSFSALHRLPQDELFHFYAGDPVEMIQINQNGELSSHTLGPDILNGQSPQRLVAGNVWQGTKLLPQGKWALMGATVTPGFEYADFELGKQADLIRQFPEHTAKIKEYSPQ